jgi:glycosyltransferase involved in cell wall biosynthesis
VARILVLGARVLFTRGGADALVNSLAKELKRRGHEVDTVELPLSMLPKESLLNQSALWRAIGLKDGAGREVDLVIATKFPTYYVSHHAKSIWLVHQHRALYDLYASNYSDISDDPRDEQFRRMIVAADAKAFAEAKYVAGISQNVIDRLRGFHGIAGDVLYPPLPLGNAYHPGNFEPYILSVGRLCLIKRVDMMIKALAIVHSHIKLKIVGAPDEPGIMEYFKSEIDRHHLWNRIEFCGRVSDEELVKLYSNAFAVYYAPHNEDYGYVTLEAMASAKPVITAHDSGGTLEFIEHNVNGIILDPTPDGIGHGINALVSDPQRAAQLGKAGRKFIEESGLAESGWDRVVNGLLSPLNKGASHAAA